MKWIVVCVAAATSVGAGAVSADEATNTTPLHVLMQQVSKLASAGFHAEARELLFAKTNDPSIAAIVPSLLALLDARSPSAPHALPHPRTDKKVALDAIEATFDAGDWGPAAQAAYDYWHNEHSDYAKELYYQYIGHIAGLSAVTNIIFTDWNIDDNSIKGTWINNADAPIAVMKVALRMKSNGVVIAESHDTVVYEHNPLKQHQQLVWTDFFTPPRAWQGEIDVAITKLVLLVTNVEPAALAGATNCVSDPLHVIPLDNREQSYRNQSYASVADVRAYAQAMQKLHRDSISAMLISQSVAYVFAQLRQLERISNQWNSLRNTAATGTADKSHTHIKTTAVALSKVHHELMQAQEGMRARHVFYDNSWMPIDDAQRRLDTLRAQRTLERLRVSFNADIKRLPPQFGGDQFDDVYTALEKPALHTRGRLSFLVTRPTKYTSNDNQFLTMYVTQESETIDLERRGKVLISRTLLRTSQYQGQNAFGAKVMVTKREYVDRFISADNIIEKFREMNRSDYFFTFGFGPLPKRAMPIQERLGILIVCKVFDARTGFSYTKPTFDDPREIVVDEKIIDATILYIWLFDKQTGEIVSKHPVRM